MSDSEFLTHGGKVKPRRLCVGDDGGKSNATNAPAYITRKERLELYKSQTEEADKEFPGALENIKGNFDFTKPVDIQAFITETLYRVAANNEVGHPECVNYANANMKLIDSLRKEFEKLTVGSLEIEQLKNDFKELGAIIQELRAENDTLKKEVATLTARLTGEVVT